MESLTAKCGRCGVPTVHRFEWRQFHVDWQRWRLYIRCTVCQRLRQCPASLRPADGPPLPDRARQQALFSGE